MSRLGEALGSLAITMVSPMAIFSSNRGVADARW